MPGTKVKTPRNYRNKIIILTVISRTTDLEGDEGEMWINEIKEDREDGETEADDNHSSDDDNNNNPQDTHVDAPNTEGETAYNIGEAPQANVDEGGPGVNEESAGIDTEETSTEMAPEDGLEGTNAICSEGQVGEAAGLPATRSDSEGAQQMGLTAALNLSTDNSISDTTTVCHSGPSPAISPPMMMPVNDSSADATADGLILCRSGRAKQRIMDVEDLHQCYCGTAVKKHLRSDAVPCSNRGCETIWVSTKYRLSSQYRQ